MHRSGRGNWRPTGITLHQDTCNALTCTELMVIKIVSSVFFVCGTVARLNFAWTKDLPTNLLSLGIHCNSFAFSVCARLFPIFITLSTMCHRQFQSEWNQIRSEITSKTTNLKLTMEWLIGKIRILFVFFMCLYLNEKRLCRLATIDNSRLQ